MKGSTTSPEMYHARLNPGSAREPKSADQDGSFHADNYAASKSSHAMQAAKSRGVRKLVLCFDGTGNKFHGDDSDSNILKIFRMLDRTADDQYHYYQPGIGTYVVSGSLTHTSVRARLGSWYTKAKDSAIGSSFDQHVVGGYRFLMRFYNPGDEIYMFGFSRGAYIARFLAEMLDYIGLLSHGNEEMVKFAWKAFSQWQCRQQSTGTDEEVAAAEAEKKRMFQFMKGFRETFSRPVGRIKFLGLFDTVNSVPRFETAWMQRSKFPYTARSSAKYIRHAVSIDERRAKFRQDLMYQGNPKVKNHQHRHLGNLMSWENWHLQGHLNLDKVRGGDEDEKSNATGTGDQPQRDESQQDLGPGKQQEKNGEPNGEGRGRPRDKFLSPQPPAAAKSAQRAASLQQGDQYRPYRPRSVSRRRTRSQLRANMDHVSEISSGLAPSDVDPDWDEDGGQDIDEVWFSGGHADVGGGWEMLEGSKSASHVPLAWIVREAMRAGLPFDAEKVAELGCACAAEWDADNPARHRTDVKKTRKQQEKRKEPAKPGAAAPTVPDIRMANGGKPNMPESPPPTQEPEKKLEGHPERDGASTVPSDWDTDSEDEAEVSFHGLMNRAHTARIHDSLAYGAGLGAVAVTAWKFMEYLPFRRMDLKGDGTWEPIRWPLPRGEVRDVPQNVRVHGSVIRRMQEDPSYRPGNLIVGGGGRGVRKAPSEYGIGDWVCVADKGDPIGEIWVRNGHDVSGPDPEVKNGAKA